MNRAEISAILWALREGRHRPIIVVSDSKNALRAAAGHSIKGSEDLCKAIHAELEGRRHTATFLKVVSHPLQKHKQPNWAHWGNDIVDSLAALGRDLPDDGTWVQWNVNGTGLKKARRTQRGRVFFHRADQVCSPANDFQQTPEKEVANRYDMGERTGPPNSMARLFWKPTASSGLPMELGDDGGPRLTQGI